jgi:hypothetical protein
VTDIVTKRKRTAVMSAIRSHGDVGHPRAR